MNEYLDARSPMQHIDDTVLFSGTSPEGRTLGCNNYFYTLDGTPIYPAMGEIHPARIDPAFWDDVLVKAKNGGLNTISFYIFWICVEPAPGVFDFSGRNDIRLFAQKCAKHGLYCVPRLGPFCNAEMAHGGLPSWLYGLPVKERTNDPGYLALVGRLYKKLAEQFEGLYWKDGGPVVGVQLENEYGHAPALWSGFYPFGGSELVHTGDGDEAHMMHLKRMAREAGFDVPFWTATSWGGAPVPAGEFIGTSGTYTFLGKGGPTYGSCFATWPQAYHTPYTTCELGTGVNVHAPWRPHVPPEGAEVSLFTSLAQGSNACGFYMYAGGSNPVTRERFYVSDMKYLQMNLISYDFCAPVGEYGMVNGTYRHLRPWLTFCSDFAADIVKTKPVWVEHMVAPEDKERVRFMPRVADTAVNGSAGDTPAGFLFLNNYQDKLQLPERRGVSVTLDTPGGRITLPDPAALPGGLTLAEDEMLALPFGLPVGRAVLTQALAVPFCRLDTKDGTTYVFRAAKKNPAQYIFPAGTALSPADGVTVSALPDGSLLVTAAPDAVFSVGGVSVLTLDGETVLHTEKITLPDGRQTLVSSQSDFTYEDGVLTMTSFDPCMTARVWNGRAWRSVTRRAPVREADASVQILNDTWAAVKAAPNALRGLDDVILELDFEGDIARIFADGLLVADHYNDGRTWQVSLRHLLRYKPGEDGLCVRLLPRADGSTAMCFDGITFKPVGGEPGKTAFRSLRLLPRYRRTVKLL